MFTAEEDKEFTNLNAAAFDLIRKQAETKNEKVPLWLCMSNTAKVAARAEFISWCRTTMAPWLSDSGIKLLVNNARLEPMIIQWKKLEAAMKAERDNGNPGGYFI